MTTIFCDRCEGEFEHEDAVTVIDGYNLVTWCPGCAQYKEEKSDILYPDLNNDKIAYVSSVFFQEREGDSECWRYTITFDVGVNASNGLYNGTIRCSRSRKGDSQYYNGAEDLPCLRDILGWEKDTLKNGVEKKQMFESIQRLIGTLKSPSDACSFAEELTNNLKERAV